MARYELIEHDADMGVRVFASSLEELFSTAGEALFSIISDTSKIKGEAVKDVEVEEDTLEELMVSWLSELLYLSVGERFLGRSVSEFKLYGLKLSARVEGEFYDPQRHELLDEVKTVTYHGLEIKEEEGSWWCEVILDV